MFPPPGPQPPSFNTLLITGPYHPSAPIHLALSLDQRAILLSPSRDVFLEDLQRFNDSWLNSNSGKGRFTNLSSNVSIFYPPTAAHLCLLLSTLCVSGPNAHENERRINDPKIFQPSAPNLIIVTELSKYFLSENDSPPTSTLTTSSYLTLLNRVLVLLGNLNSSVGPPPKFALFDSRLDAFNLPITSNVEELPNHHPRQTRVLPIIENYFEWIGVFEDDSSYIPSSQGEETTSDEGIHKQLRIYHSAEGSADDVRIHQWVEKRRLLPSESEPATDFHHVTSTA
ncbi:hypothetical protein M413DRAFT_23615 [Hebeloma cylindrosporum]|uniref:Uncharacterized protein n=1 Tax=Hebeloma cylindrosporum TaxID=76867 RepID=A0A0C2YXW2_HEBCY|nr:hypothetical protein M413DRAFT_23615 [Hebeloma cylindrosporum h7]